MEMFDCTVVGGGMVGAACALSLANIGLKVALIEKNSPESFDKTQAFDLRVSAISLGSQLLLEQLGAWHKLTQWRLCPYKRLGVWEEEFSYAEFSAEEINQSHLGHIIENRLIQLALWEQISQKQNIHVFCPEALLSFSTLSSGPYQGNLEVSLTEQVIRTKLLIGADGAHSRVREMAGIGTTGWDYQQSAMLININTQLPQQDITWQQFHPTGPVAMLPMPDTELSNGNASLVWYHQRDEINRLSALTNNQLADEIIRVFPKKLGGISVLNKAAFPLTRRHANQYVKNNVILIGDAAHSINPMAGQGVNLGFKDVSALQSIIHSAIKKGSSWSCITTLSQYEKIRRMDNLLMMSGMDALNLSFSHPSIIAKAARNIGLFVAHRVPIVKNKALKYACGLN